MEEKYYQRYNKKLNIDTYDYIIVGSGMGGLTSGVLLAKSGYKVLVLEQHYRPGGFTHSFKRKKGYLWDVGVHYVGNVEPGQPLYPLFKFLTNGELEWASLGEIYDQIRIGDDVYNFYKGKENHKQQLIRYFPNEKHAIQAYFKLLDKYTRATSLFLVEKTFKPILSHSLGWFIRKYHDSFAKQTTAQVLSKLTNNKRLRAVLAAQFGDYGSLPSESSFVAHAMVVSHFLNGGNYPVGGANQINIKMTKVLTQLGSKVLVNAPVNEIVVQDNKVNGVKINERFIPCKRGVISNVGVKNTYKDLLNNIEKENARKIEGLEHSTAHMCLYIGLDKSDKELYLPKYNVWYHKTEDFEQNIQNSTVKTIAANFAYLSFPSSKDSHWQKKHPHKATIQAVSAAQYDWFKAFENTKVMKRGEAYNALKRDFEQSMLKTVYALFPQIKGHVVLTEVSTPLSTKHFTNYKQGEIYGLAHTPKRFLSRLLRFESSIKGLHFTGQDLAIVGVGGALASGMLCVVPILKFKTFKLFKAMRNNT